MKNLFAFTRRRCGKVSIVVIISVVSLIVVAFCGGILAPMLLEARAAAYRRMSMNKLIQIGLALHNYHDSHQMLPPNYIDDESGKPLHSWRVIILPQLGEKELYNQYDLNEPWDGPNNSLLIRRRPELYADPRVANEDECTTAYQAISGPGASFDPTVPFVSFRDMRDGISNCVFLAENFVRPVIWTQPDDTSPEDFLAGATIGDARNGEIIVMMGIDFVQPIRAQDLPQVKSWTTRAAGD